VARYVVRLGFFTFGQTIKRARRLIALADARPEDRDPLLGCALILLASALDQAICVTLENLVRRYELEGQPDLGRRATELLGSSAWMRIKEAPQIVPARPFAITLKNDYVRYLRELVDRRNRLVHADEESTEFAVEVAESADSVARDAFRQAVSRAVNDGSVFAGMRISQEWESVTPAEARRAISAIELYIDAVLTDSETSESSERKLTLPTDQQTPRQRRNRRQPLLGYTHVRHGIG